MMTRSVSAFALALSTLLTTACAGFEGADDFGIGDGDEIGDEDGDAQGSGGQDQGGQDEGGHDDHEGQGPGHECTGDHGDIRPSGDGDGDGDGDVCEDQVSDLIAGQHFDTGSVSISNSEDSLEISVVTDSPYLIVEAHAYVGTDPVPLTDGGAAAPGQFPYEVSFIEPANAWQLSIPLADLEVGCGDELQIAVHAVVVAFEDGAEVFEETAWGFGPNEFETSWGWTSSFGICCEPPTEMPAVP